MSDHLKRGNVLWESSRMFLPEHREQLLARRKEKERVEKPILDEQQQEEVNRVISEAIVEGCQVTITYYDEGHIYALTGDIHSWDMYAQVLHVRDEDGEMHAIPFDHVVNVEMS